MKIQILLILVLWEFTHTLWAQPFDTLFTLYQRIDQIYPLNDGTFVLIGEGETFLIERINSKGEIIWSVPIVKANPRDDYLEDYAAHFYQEDSTIQIATARKYCDYWDTSDVKIYTISLQGMILDSSIVRAKDNPIRISLLSGHPDRPRLGYGVDKEVILTYGNGDTLHLSLTIPGADSIVNTLIGFPVAMGITPSGKILVGTTNNVLFSFREEGNSYLIDDITFFSGTSNRTRRIFSVDENVYITIEYDQISLNSFGWGPVKTIYTHYGNIFYKTIWNGTSLFVISSDSLYIYDGQLNVIYQQSLFSYEQSIVGFSVRDQHVYLVGRGHGHFEGGFVESRHFITQEGPKYYDVEITDVEMGPYDSVYHYIASGRNYHFSIPEAMITITNHGDFPVDRVRVYYWFLTGFCSNTMWERELNGINLAPGESKSYPLHDIFIIKGYPFYLWGETCLYVDRPDLHADDAWANNTFCQEFDLLPETESGENPIHHYPAVLEHEILFIAPTALDFDVSIYSMNGIKVYSAKGNTYSQFKIDLDFLPPGVYIFEYTLPVEQKRFIEKILKI